MRGDGIESDRDDDGRGAPLMQAKQRVPVLRGGQSDDLAANRVGCNRILLQRASTRRKIAPKQPRKSGECQTIRQQSEPASAVARNADQREVIMITNTALALAALLLLGIGAIPPAAYAFNYTLNTIKTCGGVIPSGATGTWIVQKNLMNTSSSVNCITIEASGVAIDLHGYTIKAPGGVGESGYGITDGRSCTPSCQQNIIIANGTIKGFNEGISLSSTEYVTIANMNVKENEYGIYLLQNYAAVTDSQVDNNMADGMSFNGSYNTVSRSAANNNGGNGMVFLGSNNTINNSPANGNGQTGMSFYNSINNTVDNSQANGNEVYGLIFVYGQTPFVSNNTITDSQANGNKRDVGIFIGGSGNLLTGDTANGNGSVGIDVVCPSNLLGNTAAGNTPNTPTGNIMTSGTGCARLDNDPAP
jgi:Right handed beta helix region